MKKFKLNERTQNAIFVYGILIWPVIHFCIFWIGMNSSMIIQSFFDWPTGEFVGFQNYIGVFKTFLGLQPAGQYEYPKAILNSLSILPLTLFINIPLTLIFSYGIYKRWRGHSVYKVVLFIPMVLSAVIMCLAFNMAMSGDYGFVCEILRMINLGHLIPANGFMGDPSTAWTCILIFSVWTGISGNLMFFCSAMSRIPQSVIESAHIDGAGELRQFLTMVVPLIWGTITTMAMSGVAQIFAWYLPTLLLTNGQGQTSTIGFIVVMHSQARTSLDFVYAFGVIISVFGTAVTVGAKSLLERFWPEVEY